MVYDERFNFQHNEKYLDQIFQRIEDESETSQVRLAEMYHNTDYVSWSMMLAGLTIFTSCTFMLFKFIRENLLDWNKLVKKSKNNENA